MLQQYFYNTGSLVVLLLCVLALLFVQYFSPKTRNSTTCTSFVYGVIVSILFISVYGGKINDTFTTSYDYVQTWNTYHYYMGSKYFNEVGYFSLYACTLQADREALQLFSSSTPVRNLREYTLVNPSETTCPKEKFGAHRWNTFKDDLVFMQTHFPVNATGVSTSYWGFILQDKGNNPTPFWHGLAGFIANRIPLQQANFMKLLLNADFIAFIACLLLLWFAFDRDTAFLSAIFLVSFFGTFEILMGGFFEYSWFPFFILGTILFQKNKKNISAIFFAITTMLWVFPLVLLVGVCIQELVASIRDKKVKITEYFSVWYFLSLFCLFVMSIISSGKEIWFDFIIKMQAHTTHLVGEQFNIGLKNFIAMFGGVSLETPSRVLYFSAHQSMWFLSVFLLSLLLILHIKKIATMENPFIIGVVCIYTVLSLSAYYYLLLLVFILPQGEQRKETLMRIGLFLLLLFHVAIGALWYVSQSFWMHFVSEILFFLFFVYVLYVNFRIRDSV